MLANNKIHWNEEKHLEFTDEVYEKINYYAINASMKIAKEKGKYSCFEGSDWHNGNYFDLRNYTSEKWNKLKDDVKKYLWEVPSGITVFLLNIPLFFVSYKYLNKRFTIYTAIGMLSFSTALMITKPLSTLVQVDDMLLWWCIKWNWIWINIL
jgi:hypothetical protein